MSVKSLFFAGIAVFSMCVFPVLEASENTTADAAKQKNEQKKITSPKPADTEATASKRRCFRDADSDGLCDRSVNDGGKCKKNCKAKPEKTDGKKSGTAERSSAEKPVTQLPAL